MSKSVLANYLAKDVTESHRRMLLKELAAGDTFGPEQGVQLLTAAIDRQDAEVIRRLSMGGVNLNTPVLMDSKRNPIHETALTYAIRNGAADAIAVLLDCNVAVNDPNISEPKQDRAFPIQLAVLAAAKTGNHQPLVALLKGHPNFGVLNRHLFRQLSTLAQADAAVEQGLMENFAHIDPTSKRGAVVREYFPAIAKKLEVANQQATFLDWPFEIAADLSEMPSLEERSQSGTVRSSVVTPDSTKGKATPTPMEDGSSSPFATIPSLPGAVTSSARQPSALKKPVPLELTWADDDGGKLVDVKMMSASNSAASSFNEPPSLSQLPAVDLVEPSAASVQQTVPAQPSGLRQLLNAVAPQRERRTTALRQLQESTSQIPPVEVSNQQQSPFATVRPSVQGTAPILIPQKRAGARPLEVAGHSLYVGSYHDKLAPTWAETEELSFSDLTVENPSIHGHGTATQAQEHLPEGNLLDLLAHTTGAGSAGSNNGFYIGCSAPSSKT